MKAFLKKFIRKIAEENDKTFGSNKLDCCGLNSNNDKNKKDSSKNK
ncbi:LDCC motif putative metal-binding protein [Clostridium sp. BSD9I1]|nr:LDCC motif putative metal-binding protein [Clostridium sp. BSD9I1]